MCVYERERLCRISTRETAIYGEREARHAEIDIRLENLTVCSSDILHICFSDFGAGNCCHKIHFEFSNRIFGSGEFEKQMIRAFERASSFASRAHNSDN